MAEKHKDNYFVLRLQDDDDGNHGLSNTLLHWDESQMYDDKQIKAIESSNKDSLSQPTSIPSPFARIALVKTAFSEVAQYGEKALKAYQLIVSETLDVAEIFFTFSKWRDRVEIIQWDKQKDLNDLKKSAPQLHKTLVTFLENDSMAYNFDKMQALYILKYKDTGAYIGATSPCTLFFSSANAFNKKNDGNPEKEKRKKIDIQLNEKRRAFEGIVPLHKRSIDFQNYLYTHPGVHFWRRGEGGIRTLGPSFFTIPSVTNL